MFDFSEEELAPGVCRDVMVNGGAEEKVNILYLGDRYVDVEDFEKDVNSFNTGFFTVEPYASLKEEFNIYRLDDFTSDLGCDQDGTVICNANKVKRVGKTCPSDFVVVLSKYSQAKDLVNPLRSASIFNLAYVNAADSYLVLSHESGHMIAGLADEYLIPNGKVPSNGVNCVRQCSGFDVLNECKKGCVNNNHYRSIDVGLMRNYWDTVDFGVFNDKVITESVLGRSSVVSDFGLSPRKGGVDDVYVVDVELREDGAAVTRVDASEGYASNYNMRGYSYRVEGDGFVEELGFGYPVLIEERGSEEGMDFKFTNVSNFTLVVPKGDVIEIFDEEKNLLGKFGLGNRVFKAGQTIKFDVDGVGRLVYIYDELDNKVDVVDLGCKDICEGEFEAKIPLVADGDYFMYYWTVEEGWRQFGVKIAGYTNTDEVVLE